MIQIKTIGGYNEVGKNCTAVRVDDEVVIFDMGIHLEHYIRETEDEDIKKMSLSKLTNAGAIPDLRPIRKWLKDVVALVPTHAHLDHVGAIPYLADKFDAPIICTPFTEAVTKAILRDEKMKIKNEFKLLNPNDSMKLSDKLTLEFIHMTHSTVQVVMAALHTPYGVVLYANDFKIDRRPVLGKKANIKRLKQLGKKGIKALIIESLYAGKDGKTPSEAVAKEMLKDVLLATDNDGKAVIVSTFSSHIARLKSIIETGKQMNRKVIFLGRSLAKYVGAAEEVGLVDFSSEVEIVKWGNKIRKVLPKLAKNKGKYLIVCTGHQGEPKAVLNRIANGKLKFPFEEGDSVVFSCQTIPTKLNIANREKLENSLKEQGVRIYKDVHVSGHGSKEDLRDVINMTNPEYLLPAHGELNMETALADLATNEGYEIGKNVFILKNDQIVDVE